MGSHVGDVLDVWPNEVVQRVQVGGRRGPVREGYKVVALLLKPSLGLFGLVGRCLVLLPHRGSITGHLIAPGDHHTLQHIQVHFGFDFQADFEDVRWDEVAFTWNHTKDHNCSRKLCFHHPGHVPVIRGNPDLHFVGAGNDSVVIIWIGRDHEVYSSTSPISLVEHCVTFRHDRRLLSLLGFVHNWPTSRWSATKKENRFSLNRNGIRSSFLGRQFYRSTLCIYIYIYIYVCVCVCVCVYIYIYRLIYMCVFINKFICVYFRICMYVYLCVYLYMYIHVCIYIYIHICIYMHIHLCVCIYIYMHWYIFVCIFL